MEFVKDQFIIIELAILVFCILFLGLTFRYLKMSKKNYRESIEIADTTSSMLKGWEIEFNRSQDDLVGRSLIEKFKEMPRYKDLSGKHEWYLFNLQSIVFYIKGFENKEELKDFNIFEVAEAIAIAWCKRSEDVFKDLTIISEHYNTPKEESTTEINKYN
jgi:hypothetical protein